MAGPPVYQDGLFEPNLDPSSEFAGQYFNFENYTNSTMRLNRVLGKVAFSP
jgi:hypothetical protein